MRRIDRVIYSEINAPSLIALLVLTFVVFTREFGRLAELLIRRNADLLTVAGIVFSLLPGILVFTLPFAFLIGTLIGFSRLSADSEVVAMRANGVSVYQMVRPVLKAALMVSAVTFVLTVSVLPRANWNLSQIRHQIGLRPVQSEIKPRVFNEDLPGMVLYVEDIELGSSSWKGVFLADSGSQGEKRTILSRHAYTMFSEDGQRLQLHFEEGAMYRVHPDSPEKLSLTTFQTLDVPVDAPELDRVEIGPKRPRDRTLAELLAGTGGPDGRNHRIEFQRRMALPLSPLIFAALGVALGAHSRRGGRGYGFVVSMVIAFSYYILFATGSELAEDGRVSALWGVWGANILFGLVALVSLSHPGTGLRWTGRFSNHAAFVFLVRLLGGLSRLVQSLPEGLRRGASSLPAVQIHFSQVIDRYMMGHFASYFLITFCICVALFYLFTFFELLDDLFAHQAPLGLLADYFLYLFPHVLMWMVPISILIGTLVTFGLMEKTNQLVALKSCGVSIFRMAVPVIAVTLAVSGIVFVVQEYVLPYANQRQDSLRNVIKGKPVQTHYQLGHKWIFGEENRLYNYNYYDSEQQVFAELSVYQLDIAENQLSQHIYAQRAVWDARALGWRLYNGWRRGFAGGSTRFSAFQEELLFFPESPSYFQKEVQESSKMTYLELQGYVDELQRAGFEVDHLKTDMHRKLSFPLLSVIMSVLAVPFALTLGRKGALYGIAAGVLIGIVYWGTDSIFGVLGANGLLSPLLAAWGPNLLFGAGSVVLLLDVRT